MANTDYFPLDPDYPVRVTRLSGVVEQLADSGKRIGRRARPDQRLFELHLAGRSTDEIESLREFYHRLRNDYFIFRHKAYTNNAGSFLTREFPVEFAAELEEELFTNDAYNGPIVLREAVGQAIAPNPFKNTDFDLWTGAAPTDWTDESFSSGGGTKETVDVRSGYAIKITGDGVTQNRGILTQPAAAIIKPGTPYAAVVWLRKDATIVNGALRIHLLGTGVSSAGIDRFVSTLTTSWARYTGDIADGGQSLAPSDLKLRLALENIPTNGGSVWVDRLLIVEGATAADLLWPDALQGHESFFMQETVGSIVAGTWTEDLNNAALGKRQLNNANTNTTDAFQWAYAGYGFRLWSRRLTNLGIADVYLDGTKIGSVDFYESPSTVSKIIFTKLDVPLGLHRVKLQATNTKNAASTGNVIIADALEVLL